MSVTAIQPGQIVTQPAPLFDPPEFQLLGSAVFNVRFEHMHNPKAKNIHTDESSFSDFSVTSWGVGDCITIFAIEMDPENPLKVKTLSGYHLSVDGTTVKEILDEYVGDLETTNSYLYIIGGLPRPFVPGQTLQQKVRTAIETHFGSLDVIYQELNAEGDLLDMHGIYRTLDANLSLDEDGKPQLFYSISKT